MLKPRNLSNQKIMLFVAFICAALMSSVFIYHASQKPHQVIPPEEGFIFPAPRALKSFTLSTKTNPTFTEKNLYGHWTLLFFGFTHCNSICPNSLNVLQQIYKQLHLKYANLQVVFISIDPERDTPMELAQYVERFHPDFIGATGQINTLHKLQSQLGIYAAREPGQSENYQIQHTSSILLINPHSEWMGVYKLDIPVNTLAQHIEKTILIG